ncbi:MAG: hypothetical protein OSB00_01590 [Sphingomonas bacterium]|nr:hypothetical protein [Sphingomonas bacterium]
MGNSNFGRTLATILCTIVFSATCVLSAVGPAQAGAPAAASETAARHTA